MPFMPTASVVVQRDLRIRREIKQEDIESLAESIIRLGGLIHPIVVREGCILISGETRLEAHKFAGLDQIEYKNWEDLSEFEALAIEIEENIKRKDLPWQDQCDALKRFHFMHCEQEVAWSTENTAERIGLSIRQVQKYLAVAEEISSGNEMVANAPKLSTAIGITRRAKERAKADEAGTIKKAAGVAAPKTPFENLDFIPFADSFDTQPFNFLHCDFPYGINADTFNQGAADSFGGYKDTFEHYENLLNCLERNIEKLLGESGHCLFWYSMKHHEYTLQRLTKIFQWIDPYPLVWHKSDNKGTLPDPERGPRRVYEVAFLASRGDRKIIRSVSNVFSGPTSRTGEHMSEKSQDMLEYFFQMLVDKNTRMLDPTAGSGSALRAARKLGATNLLGLEVNPEFCDNARRAWLR